MNTGSFSPPLLELYGLGALLTANLLAAWFHSNLAQHVWNLLHRGDPVFTKDDLTAAAIERHPTFGDLWVCPLCLGTWFALVVSGVLAAGWLPAPWGARATFIAAATLTWPILYYVLHKHLSR